jgi:hypothetical protein
MLKGKLIFFLEILGLLLVIAWDQFSSSSKFVVVVVTHIVPSTLIAWWLYLCQESFVGALVSSSRLMLLPHFMWKLLKFVLVGVSLPMLSASVRIVGWVSILLRLAPLFGTHGVTSQESRGIGSSWMEFVTGLCRVWI